MDENCACGAELACQIRCTMRRILSGGARKEHDPHEDPLRENLQEMEERLRGCSTELVLPSDCTHSVRPIGRLIRKRTHVASNDVQTPPRPEPRELPALARQLGIAG